MTNKKRNLQNINCMIEFQHHWVNDRSKKSSSLSNKLEDFFHFAFREWYLKLGKTDDESD